MVFSGLPFLFMFLPIVLAIYYISPIKIKNIIILISGLFFYAWGEPVYVAIMILSTVIDYTAGRFMHRFDHDKHIRFICLLISVVMNLSLLGVFKYGGFILHNINAVFGTAFSDKGLALPIGISFYTFQSMSYTIDLYLRKIKVQKNVFSFTAYVSLFPQIVAGPIVRYEDVQNEIDNRTLTEDMVADGIKAFISGLAKKVLLANNIGLLWSVVSTYNFSEMSMATAWLGIIAFSFQIYFDFSGYSDMAVGLGKMLGFNFPRNFNYPYISKSISEFWRRWHITLGSWFRSYVYIPLGGNRLGKVKTLRNLIIVWFLTGLWHGASWNFVLWGLYFGIIIIAERVFLGKILERLPALICRLYSYLLVLFGWVLFQTETLPAAGAYLGAMFGQTGVITDSRAFYLLSNYLLMFIICIIASTDLVRRGYNKIRDKLPKIADYASTAVAMLILLICTAFLVEAGYNPFLYFRF